jgi:hypothetical protein
MTNRLTPTQNSFGRARLILLTTIFGAEAEYIHLGKRTFEIDSTGIRTRVFAARGRCPWPLGGPWHSGFRAFGMVLTLTVDTNRIEPWTTGGGL